MSTSNLSQLSKLLQLYYVMKGTLGKRIADEFMVNYHVHVIEICFVITTENAKNSWSICTIGGSCCSSFR